MQSNPPDGGEVDRIGHRGGAVAPMGRGRQTGQDQVYLQFPSVVSLTGLSRVRYTAKLRCKLQHRQSVVRGGDGAKQGGDDHRGPTDQEDTGGREGQG